MPTPSRQSPSPDYDPIKDYALLGDCHGAALVSRRGNVDWCCFDRFDNEPALWRLLDARQGGLFQISPIEPGSSERAYLPDTNILRTVHRTVDGSVSVTDFMPLETVMASQGGESETRAAGWLVRIVECLGGKMDVRIEFQQPSNRLISLDGKGVAPGNEFAGFFYADESPGTARTEYNSVVSMHAGDTRVFVLAPSAAAALHPPSDAVRLRATTQSSWEAWCARCSYQGPYAQAVRRSALALKAMTYAPTGAIVAAPTTSLPEEPGGVRNWDYRFTWLRDSSFVLQALSALGYCAEARKFCEFIQGCCIQTLPTLRVLYGIGGETDLQEVCLSHVEGYLGSQPVRIGNAAVNQKQIDIYGEVADWALVYHQLGGELDGTLAKMLSDMADHVAQHWHEPDQGIWEIRSEPRHHVHSKAMAWVALDRALRLLGPNEAWLQAREAVLAALMERGVSQREGHLVQFFGSEDVDAALLAIPLLDLPLDEAILQKTVAAVKDRLLVNDYVQRYLTHDGMPGSEGAFLICSFWLVDALVVTGQPEEGRQLFERLLTAANDLGLFAEQIDPVDGAFLGNFPQAFTHLALINSAVLLELHRHGGAAAVKGTQADRARRAVLLTGAPSLTGA